VEELSKNKRQIERNLLECQTKRIKIFKIIVSCQEVKHPNNRSISQRGTVLSWEEDRKNGLTPPDTSS
jgi:hypothetical protein